METNLQDKIKKDLAIMRILKTTELRYHIGMTGVRASIDLVIRKENPTYQFYIDASPLEEVENKAMLKLFDLK